MIFTSFVVLLKINYEEDTTIFFALLCFILIFGQKDNLWTPAKNLTNKEIKANKRAISTPTLFNLDVDKLKQTFQNLQEKQPNFQNLRLSFRLFPISESEFQNFSIYKTSNFHQN